jgi:hypothetical protein
MFGTGVDTEHPFPQHGLMHRTYVRRRLAALTLAISALVALGGPVASALGAGDDPMRLVSHRRYVVRPGDTLWTIARRVAPGRDPRSTIHEIEEANDVSAGSLMPGQAVSVPVGG